MDTPGVIVTIAHINGASFIKQGIAAIAEAIEHIHQGEHHLAQVGQLTLVHKELLELPIIWGANHCILQLVGHIVDMVEQRHKLLNRKLSNSRQNKRWRLATRSQRGNALNEFIV